ncbi:MAG: hypothetical protein WD176_00965, partial [Pirellulales bacterium]
TPRGLAVLIIPGLRASLFPEQSIHAVVPPDDCDGVAPERMGVGQSSTLVSDIYALGCLLWELLAGRPPFPHGDPLAKLAAHQSQHIPDVRDWAPETPPALAELILQLTRKSASQRPQSFRDVAVRLQQVRRASRRQLLRFTHGDAASLPGSSTETSSAPGGVKALAVGILLLAAGSVVLLNAPARNELLSIARRNPPPAEPVHVEPDAKIVTTPKADSLLPLPAPNAEGVIELTGPGPYDVGDVSSVRRLTIRGSSRVRSAVVIGEQPLRVRAEQLILESIDLVRRMPLHESGAAGSSPLLQVAALEFALRHCRLDNGGLDRQPAVEWTLSDTESSAGGSTIVFATTFVGGGPAIQVHGFPTQASFDNVLHCGPRALLELAAPPGRNRAVDVVARRVTLRGASPLVDVRLLSPERFPASLTLTLEDSVAELDRAALVEFSGHDAPGDWPRRLRITGEGSVVRPGAEIVGLRSAPERLRPL